jgi:hypothetical protein
MQIELSQPIPAPKKTKNLGDLVVNVRITLKLTFKKYNEKARTKFA